VLLGLDGDAVARRAAGCYQGMRYLRGHRRKIAVADRGSVRNDEERLLQPFRKVPLEEVVEVGVHGGGDYFTAAAIT
jgi:hypothetical protein